MRGYLVRPAKVEGKMPAVVVVHENRGLNPYIEDVARQYKGLSQAPYSEDGHTRYLQAIDGMRFGDSPEHGLTRGASFLHPGLNVAMTAPNGWRILNESESVTLVNAAGDAGLVMQLAPANASKDREALLRQLIQPVSGEVDAREFNGLQATHFNGVVRNSKGQQAAMRLTVVSGPGGRSYLLRYVAKDAAALKRALPQIEQAERSFRAMNKADQQAARPWTVRTVPYPKGGFAELARQSPLETQAQEHLRLLNSVYGSSRDPAVGTSVKTVR